MTPQRPPRFRFRALVVAVAATVLTVAACDAPPPPPPPGEGGPSSGMNLMAPPDGAGPAPVVLDTFDFGGDFTLTDHTRASFDLAGMRGRVLLLFFGFTHCPDVCPLTLSRVARALDQLDPANRQDVRTLFVTVDVDRDTPAVLAKYFQGLPMPVTGLTGTRAQVDAVVAQYRASYEVSPSPSAAGPTVSHSTYLYLIDRDGRVRHLFKMADPPGRLAEGLRLALREPGAGAAAPAR